MNAVAIRRIPTVLYPVGVALLAAFSLLRAQEVAAQEVLAPRHFVREASVVRALSEVSSVQAVKVRVRAIEAKRDQGAQKQSRPHKVGKGLADLEGKLSELSFDSFRLLGTQDAQIELKKKYVMSLINRDQLTLRPLYVEGKRTGLWLKWRDPAGLEILDTRLHFACGESMLAGANANSSSAVILAIDVSAVR